MICQPRFISDGVIVLDSGFLVHGLGPTLSLFGLSNHVKAQAQTFITETPANFDSASHHRPFSRADVNYLSDVGISMIRDPNTKQTAAKLFIFYF
jgi:hypothetical protein